MAEVALLAGLQASGKSTFYRQRLASTHAHVSKDNWPNARHREQRQRREIAAALIEGRDVAVDNTNPSRHERVPLIEMAHAHGAKAVGYWFPPDPAVSLARNAQREGRKRVPDVGLFSTLKRLTRPSFDEGFDALYTVRQDGRGGFTVTPWARETVRTASSRRG
ncbi:ATP-binding protein [Planosporangium thailandense]|uniref:ATP-binding protein n=1 Tax=Planosporangium thailandense TaxID=765197 RepID=A0ABX0Y4P3_9ACTN|nr:ATP-binding protein [Planosporangium thailandense]NJC73381.1 ATP-binding protein [Planosporangium thailandense]